MTNANALMLITPGEHSYRAGQPLPVLRLR
jgi:hypothetical protein